MIALTLVRTGIDGKPYTETLVVAHSYDLDLKNSRSIRHGAQFAVNSPDWYKIRQAGRNVAEILKVLDPIPQVTAIEFILKTSKSPWNDTIV